MPNNMFRPYSRSSSDKDPKPKTRPSFGGLPVKYLDRLASLISFLSASSTKLIAQCMKILVKPWWV